MDSELVPGLVGPAAYRCPITERLMANPVQASDGFTYERSAINNWMKTRGHAFSPMDSKVLPHSDLIPNKAIKDAIKEWCEENNHPVPVELPDELVEQSLESRERALRSRAMTPHEPQHLAIGIENVIEAAKAIWGGECYQCKNMSYDPSMWSQAIARYETESLICRRHTPNLYRAHNSSIPPVICKKCGKYELNINVLNHKPCI